MADNEKYYYLRLKEDFFDDDAIKILEAMPDGYLYSNILLKLYLKSLKYDGKLMFNERIPYNSAALATVTRHNVGTIEKALDIFQQFGLIEVLDNGSMYMLDIQTFIGKTSTEADRKRAYRERIDSEKQLLIGQTSGQMSGHCPLEIEKDIDIELEKEIKPKKETKHKYGAYAHVLLSDTEIDRLKSEYGEQQTQSAITYLDEYIEMKGYKAKNHNLCIRKWVFDAVKEKAKKQPVNFYDDMRRWAEDNDNTGVCNHSNGD